MISKIEKFKLIIYVLFFLTVLIPIVRLIIFLFGIGFNTGYLIEFPGAIIYEFILATISSIVVIITIINKNNTCFNESVIKNIIISIVLFLLSPLSFINSMFLIAYGPETRWQILFLFIYTFCCVVITLFFLKPLLAKIVSLAISVFPAGIVYLYFFIGFIFIGFTSRTVMNTIDSPNGKKYVEVVYADAGATGASTLVEINEKFEINLVIVMIKKKSKIIYSGRLNEYENMKIYWENDKCIVINSKEYLIE